MDVLTLLGRTRPLFEEDMRTLADPLRDWIEGGRFLVVGAAGSIGRAVAQQIARRSPRVLHLVDLSENNLVEVIRDLRAAPDAMAGDLQAFAIDAGGPEGGALIRRGGGYDAVLNLAALKHVRSEHDAYTLMRMLRVNVLDSLRLAELAEGCGAGRYFCVSTDKASAPVNMMGASKLLMERALVQRRGAGRLALARFANVAFSDGSLLHGFGERLRKRQPFSVPHDVRRYFMTDQEAAELCLIAAFEGQSGEVFFPKETQALPLTPLVDIARHILRDRGYRVVEFSDPHEARQQAAGLIAQGAWPLHLFASDTTGEKLEEVFHAPSEAPRASRFAGVGILGSDSHLRAPSVAPMLDRLRVLQADGQWDRRDLVALMGQALPEFAHHDTGRFLGERM